MGFWSRTFTWWTGATWGTGLTTWRFGEEGGRAAELGIKEGDAVTWTH